MLKKILLILVFLSASLFANNDELTMSIPNKDNQYIKLEFKTFGYGKRQGNKVGQEYLKNWIAIYKKGDSNDWDNVIEWAWVSEINNIAGKTLYYNYKVSTPGIYELRFFLNNGYETFTSFEFQITEQVAKPYVNIIGQSRPWLTLNTSFVGEQSWIGIYKKGASNDWSNVIDWSFISKNSKSFRLSGYRNGTYEARLFYNNSYDVEAKTEFVIEGRDVKDNFIKITDQNYNKIELSHGVNVSKMTWLAIFEKGAESKPENVLQWKYLTDYMCCPNYHYSTSFEIKDLSIGDYEIRLFNNNSYILEAQADLKISQESYDGQWFVKLTDKYVPSGKIEIVRNNYIKPKEGDWFALFDLNADYNIDNLIAWSYVDDYRDNQKSMRLKILKDGFIKNAESMRVVYFGDDSYDNPLKEEDVIVDLTRSPLR